MRFKMLKMNLKLKRDYTKNSLIRIYFTMNKYFFNYNKNLTKIQINSMCKIFIFQIVVKIDQVLKRDFI
jgi:hypothetical protein